MGALRTARSLTSRHGQLRPYSFGQWLYVAVSLDLLPMRRIYDIKSESLCLRCCALLELLSWASLRRNLVTNLGLQSQFGLSAPIAYVELFGLLQLIELSCMLVKGAPHSLTSTCSCSLHFDSTSIRIFVIRVSQLHFCSSSA